MSQYILGIIWKTGPISVKGVSNAISTNDHKEALFSKIAPVELHLLYVDSYLGLTTVSLMNSDIICWNVNQYSGGECVTSQAISCDTISPFLLQQ